MLQLTHLHMHIGYQTFGSGPFYKQQQKPRQLFICLNLYPFCRKRVNLFDLCICTRHKLKFKAIKVEVTDLLTFKTLIILF